MKARTKLINHVRGAVKNVGSRIPICEGPEYFFTYRVLSTEYVVTFRLHAFAPFAIHCTWTNLSPTGESVTGEVSLVRAE